MIPEEIGSSAAFIPILALLGLLALLGVIAGNLYFVHQNGQTIGKKVVGIKIVRADRRTDAGFWRIVIRRFGSTMVMSVVSLVSLIDVLFIFSKTRQCLHDRMADTTVVDVQTAGSEEEARAGESRSEFDEELSYETPDVEW